MHLDLSLLNPVLNTTTFASPLGHAARDRRIVVDAITKSFGSLQVIDGISFEVAKGSALAIVGPSGCGKSTLLNIIAGFDKPDRGSVLVDGTTRQEPTPKGIVISQQGSVFPWLTVQKNLMFGLTQRTNAERTAVADHYTALVGLQGFEHAYPRELSGGMLKRVELARALATKPEILFMDEPFSALDALIARRMRNELVGILQKERHTLVIITHDVEEAIHLADRVLVLSNRPTKVKAFFDVPCAHPRKLSSPEAQELKEAILVELGL